MNYSPENKLFIPSLVVCIKEVDMWAFMYEHLKTQKSCSPHASWIKGMCSIKFICQVFFFASSPATSCFNAKW